MTILRESFASIIKKCTAVIETLQIHLLNVTVNAMILLNSDFHIPKQDTWPVHQDLHVDTVILTLEDSLTTQSVCS